LNHSIAEAVVDGSDSDEDEELLEANMNYLKLTGADMDTNRVEEVPAKEPKLNAMPVKSALKKKGLPGSAAGSGASTPTQDAHKIVGVKYEQHSK
jgi:phosphatase and actin regulator 3